MSSFNQAVPGVPTVINASNVFVYGNTSSGNALSVQQLGAGNVASFRTQTGASALFVSSAGNVGIGQTNPVFTLDTTGTARVTSNLVVGTQSTPTTPFWIQKNAASGISGTAQTAWLGQALITDANGTQFLSIGSDQTNAVSFLQAYGAGVNKPLSLQPNGGYVGIGTTSPGYLLEVSSSTSSTSTSFLGLTNPYVFGFNTGLNIGSSIVYSSRWQGDGGSGVVEMCKIDGRKEQNANYGDSYLAFQTRYETNRGAGGAGTLTEKMRISGNGNVGIGITNPQNALQVAGTSSTISVGGAAGWSNVVQLGNVSYNQYGSVSAFPANRFTVLTSGLPGVNDLPNANGGLYVASQGLRLTGQRLVWGSTSYESAIEIDGGRSAMAGVNNGQIRFYTANAQRAVIDESGNVGIGTASPGSFFQIYGPAADTATNSGVPGANTYISATRGFTYNTSTTAVDMEIGSSNRSAGDTGSVYKYRFGTRGTGVSSRPLAFYVQGVPNTTYTSDGTPVEYFTILGNGNVGIGTTNPSAPLHVASGSAGAGTTNTTQYLADFQYAPSAPTTGNLLTAAVRLRAPTSGGQYYGGEIMGGLKEGSDHYLMFNTYNSSTSTTRMTILGNSGNVGIGTTSPRTILDVNGDSGITVSSTNGAQTITYIYTGFTTNGGGYNGFTTGAGTVSFRSGASGGVTLGSGATTWTTLSDSRLKNVIEPISNAISKVDQINPVIYTLKDDESNIRRVGVIAQDVLEVQPEAVGTGDDGMYGVRYTELIPLALAAIKELSAENTALKQSLVTATARLDSLEARLAAAGL